MEELNVVRELIDGLSNLVATGAKNNDLINSVDIDPEKIFKIELMFFLMYLSASDGVIDKEEVQVINYLFDLNMQSYHINDMINEHNIYSREFENRIPISIMISVNMDNFMWNVGKKESTVGSETIISTIQQIGMLIVKSNGNINIDKMNSLRNYIANLEKYREDNFDGASSIIGLIKN
ncbi:MAG: hypothetical protein MJ081_02320 [Ruminococcus sp.]|nr:hypothetical protein [Ruminococcus sp.]